MWRSLLYKELDDWYKEYQPSKKRKSLGAASGRHIVVFDRKFKDVVNLVDYLDIATNAGGAGAPAAGVAPAAAANAAAAAPGAGGGPV
jgi:hypothetical protein